jgi:type II secretory ATPase GspE/PulE/Tfp pilus assembly ATPase PilB-like protein
LNRLSDSTRKIVTIEDPVEYTLPGAIQMQVMAQIDLTFGRLLRTVLRHDPNVIMVGEIRDQETAEIAIRTALTGHLVLSTLHTNDAASTVTRILEMGIEPYLAASSLSCVIAQRLVRTVCKKCRGKRCLACLGQGLKGRIGIFEFLLVEEAIRELILKQSSAEEIRQCAQTRGMVTLYEDGMNKVKSGITTKEELDRVIHQDELK